jgi:hypothetical protein
MPSCNWLIPMAKVEAKECGALVWGWRVCANERGRSEVEANAIKASACVANQLSVGQTSKGQSVVSVGQTRAWGRRVKNESGANTFRANTHVTNKLSVGRTITSVEQTRVGRTTLGHECGVQHGTRKAALSCSPWRMLSCIVLHGHVLQ